MQKVRAGELPQESMLQLYRQAGAYTDCYFVDVPRAVSQREYIEAFYTTPLFKVERLLLSVLTGRISTDAQAKSLADAQAERFAAWHVEGRASNQLLLCDFLGRTRSWLMVCTAGEGTRLYFGSAVIPKGRRAGGQASFGLLFYALGGFHRSYSRALLLSAMLRALKQVK